MTSSRKMARGLVYLTLAALAVLGSATTSRATIQVRITEDNNPLNPQIFSATSGDTTFLLPASGTLGGPSLTNFTLSGLDVSTLSSTTQETLSLNGGTIIASATSVPHTLKIEATEVFQTPSPGPNFLLTSSAGDTNNTGLIGTHTSQSLATPGSFPFTDGGTGTVSPTVLSFTLGTGSTSNNSSQVSFANDLSVTTLTSVITITINSGSQNGNIQPTVSTNLSLPEPSSVVLVSLGALWVVGLARKHHRARGRDRTDAEATSQESNCGGSPQ